MKPVFLTHLVQHNWASSPFFENECEAHLLLHHRLATATVSPHSSALLFTVTTLGCEVLAAYNKAVWTSGAHTPTEIDFERFTHQYCTQPSATDDTMITSLDPKAPAVVFNTPADPNGIDQHAAGAKLDAGKPRLSLVLGGFSKALFAVGEVGTKGAKKYTDDGWKTVENGETRYTDALARHLFLELGGEEYDPDPSMQTLHAAQTAWNALARLELILRRKEMEQGVYE